MFHSLRASFLTWLAEAGVEKALRDRLIGHAPADVGEKHYTARTLMTLRDAIETIKLDLRTGRGRDPSRASRREAGEDAPKTVD